MSEYANDGETSVLNCEEKFKGLQKIMKKNNARSISESTSQSFL